MENRIFVIFAIAIAILFGCNKTPDEIELVWEKIDLPEDEYMTVSVSEDGILYAVVGVVELRATEADRSKIYISEDQGDTWLSIDISSVDGSSINAARVRIYDIMHLGNDILIHTDLNFPSPNELLLSKDSGNNWGLIFNRIDYNAKIDADRYGNIAISDPDGFFYKTVNFGEEWRSYSLPSLGQSVIPNFKPFLGVDSTNYFLKASGISGDLYITNDGGSSWNIYENNFGSIAKNSNGTFIALGSSIFRSLDGRNWEKIQNLKFGESTVVTLHDDNFLIMTRNDGFLITSDQGKSWKNIKSSRLENGSTIWAETNSADLRHFMDDKNNIYIASDSKTRLGISVLYRAKLNY